MLTSCARSNERESQAFEPDSARVALSTLANLLETDFVYPDKGKAYATLLREGVASGKYLRAQSHRELARRVTTDLQALSPEGHLRLVAPGETNQAGPNADVPHAGQGAMNAKWLAPGVGYMSLHGFSGDSAQFQRLMTRLRVVLDTFATAKTLIVDARYYIGGALEETDVMASYFFAEPATLLEFDVRLDIERRGVSPLVESERLRRIDAPEGIVRRRQIVVPGPASALRTARIYVLTSKRTASGGEGFALAMKRSGRATLIGEVTAGAGHFGRTRSLGGGYSAFIPIGRPFDPTTGKGWELVGVEPHVRVPAEQALDEALRLAAATR